MKVNIIYKNLADARMADRLRPFPPLAQSWLIPSHRIRNCGPHNSHSREEGPHSRSGLPLFSSRYVPKMNGIHQTVCPRSTHFPKIGPLWAIYGPITPPFGGRSGLNLAGMFPLSRGMLVPNLIPIVQSWPIPSHRTQNFGAHNSPSGGGGGRPLGWGLVLTRGRYRPK